MYNVSQLRTIVCNYTFINMKCAISCIMCHNYAQLHETHVFMLENTEFQCFRSINAHILEVRISEPSLFLRSNHPEPQNRVPEPWNTPILAYFTEICSKLHNLHIMCHGNA